MSLAPLQTNSFAAAQQPLSRLSDQLQQSMYRLAGGKAQDDPGRLAVATILRAQVAGLRQAQQNTAQAASLADTAYGGLSQIANVLNQMKALAAQASTGSLTDTQRAFLNHSFRQLSAQMDTIASGTKFGGQKLLDGSIGGANALTFQIGSAPNHTATLEIEDVSADALFGGQTLSLATQQDASDALDIIGDAIATLGGAMAEVGGVRLQLDFAGLNLESLAGNTNAAASSLLDTDFAAESTRLMQLLLQQKTAAAVLAQTRALGGGLLDLVHRRD